MRIAPSWGVEVRVSIKKGGLGAKVVPRRPMAPVMSDRCSQGLRNTNITRMLLLGLPKSCSGCPNKWSQGAPKSWPLVEGGGNSWYRDTQEEASEYPPDLFSVFAQSFGRVNPLSWFRGSFVNTFKQASYKFFNLQRFCARLKKMGSSGRGPPRYPPPRSLKS